MTYSGHCERAKIRAEIASLKARIRELEASLVTIYNTAKRGGELTQERWKAFAEARQSGKSVRQIADEFECDETSVRHGLKKLGIRGDARYLPRDPALKPFVRAHYAVSGCYKTTALDFGISPPTVKAWVSA